MSERIKGSFIRPWRLYLASVILMIGMACPRYRMTAGQRIGPLRYLIDSVRNAILMPGWSFPSAYIGFFLGPCVWLIAVISLGFSYSRGGRIFSYLLLILLWVMYLIGWAISHGAGGS